MLPAALLEQVVGQLIIKTKANQMRWNRRGSSDAYEFDLGQAKLILQFHPSRTGADAMELQVLTPTGELVGSLYEDEDDRPRFDAMAELLFWIQRALNQPLFAQTANKLIELLPKESQARWHP